MNDIPPEIIEAANKIDIYFKKQGISDWQLMNICSRSYAKKYTIMITDWGDKNLSESASTNHSGNK